MSVTRAFTLRTLKKNRVRTAVTIAGIALATALITAVLASVSSLNAFMYDQELATNGAWQGRIQTRDADAVSRAQADPAFGATTVVTELGVAELPPEAARVYGDYLPLKGIEADYGDLCALEITEGRMPENDREIVLHIVHRESDAFSDTPLQLGSTMTLELGKRQAITEDEQLAAAMPPYLDSSTGRLDSDAHRETAASGADTALEERLVQVGDPREYTVVGFYRTTNMNMASGIGACAVTRITDRTAAPTADGIPTAYEMYATVPGATSTAEVRAAMLDAFPADAFPSSDKADAAVSLHLGLMRHAGMTDDRAIWDSLEQIAFVLAIVIAVASVSLIYNSFAISVTERTRQFGLLASVGASRRQILCMVLAEAGALGLIGIPLGLLVGMAGAAVVLTALSPALSEILGGQAQFGLHAEPSHLIAAAALSAVVVLLSAWIPARRAARVSAVDAVRRVTDIRDTKATARTDLADPWKPRGLDLASRLFGISGALGKRNVRRSKGKGRAAVLSLTVAVVLLVTAGVFDSTLRSAVRATGAAHECDVAITSYGTIDDHLATFVAACDDLDRTEGVTPMGRIAMAELPVSIPADMASDSLRADLGSVDQPDGSVQTQLSLALLDPASYRTYLQDAGLDPATYLDANEPLAIVNSATYTSDGENYRITDALEAPGAIDVYRYDLGSIAGDDLAAQTLSESFIDAEHLGVSWIDENGDEHLASRDEAAKKVAEIHVGALVDTLPAAIGANTRLFVVLPLTDATIALMNSLVDHQPVTFNAPYFAQDHVAAAKAFQTYAAKNLEAAYVNDNAAEEEQNQMLATVVSTFSFSFAAILALIAVTNVFNTLANSLTLRRREFAMLRSVGMGNAAFNRMIAWECIRYGAIALVAGTLVSLGVAWLLHDAMSLSVEGLRFTVPWAHLGIAIAVVLASTAASTLYGLRRARSSNVVEALRTDAM